MNQQYVINWPRASGKSFAMEAWQEAFLNRYIYGESFIKAEKPREKKVVSKVLVKDLLDE